MIVGDTYRQTLASLRDDPIIQDMALELLCDLGDQARVRVNDPDFMLLAIREYQRRGGKVPTHIGGPAHVIRMVVEAGR
jgi:hypothetical protein